MSPSILRLPAVMARIGLARSTIYLRISQGTFPKPIALGPRAVGWIEAEIDEWIEGQIERSRRPINQQEPSLPHGPPQGGG